MYPGKHAYTENQVGSLVNAAVTQWIKYSHWQPLVYLHLTFLARSSFLSLLILPRRRFPRLFSPSSLFMSAHFTLVNHTQLSPLVSVPRLPFPSFILLCAPRGQGAARQHQLPLHASVHCHASCLTSCSYLSPSACPSPWLFTYLHLQLCHSTF